MKIKNQNRIPSKYVLLILIVVCGILMGAEQLTGGKGPLSFVANYTIIPMQKGIGYIGRWTGDMKDNFKTLDDLKKENEELQSKLDDMTIDNTRLRQEQYELERLQELYKLDQNYADYKKVGAHVIASSGSNWFSTFTIDKGSNDGIKVDMNVLAGSGLAGIVTEVGPDYAQVRSIIDDESNVSGMTLSTSDLCMVRGDLKLMSDGRIRFEKLPNNDHKIEVGEQVVTSHISSKYLQGLFIGYISEIEVDSNNLTRSGYITPAVDFSNIQEVLVITSTKEDLTQNSSDSTRGNNTMKRKIITCIFIIAAFLLQSTIFGRLTFSGIRPNLLIAVTASIGFMRGRKEGMGVGFICGLLVDIFWGGLIGFYALIYTVIGYMNGSFQRSVV